VASDTNKLKRQSFFNVAIATRNHRGLLAGNKLQQDIRRWLSPPDPWKNHNIARGSRHRGTAAWFVEGDTLLEWKASGPSSLLWIHGKRQLPLSAHPLAKTDGFPLS
jgi:hypothetical protein